MRKNLNLAYAASVTQTPGYVPILHPFDGLQMLTNINYWIRVFMFEYCLRVGQSLELFISWPCVNIFEIATRRRDDLFFKHHHGGLAKGMCCLLFEPTPTIFTYHMTFAIRRVGVVCCFTPLLLSIAYTLSCQFLCLPH